MTLDHMIVYFDVLIKAFKIVYSNTAAGILQAQ